MEKTVGIIGAGIAGMAAGIRLANKGYEVTIFDGNDYPGGKLTELRLGKYRFDAGPSLFTMPDYVDELFRISKKDPKNHFSYKQLSNTANYFFDDGISLQASANPQLLATELEDKLGEPTANTLAALKHSSFLYDHLADLFIHRSLHDVKTFFNRQAFKAYKVLHKLDLFRTMHAANRQRFAKDKTTQLFNRYATYNGSSPYLTPATMNIIPHLEFGVGAFIPEKGMHQITESLFTLAKESGVEFRFNSPVKKINLKSGKVTGLRVNGQDHPFDNIVSNMDMVATYKRLLPDTKAPARLLNQPKSSSALIFYWGIKKNFKELDLHNIFFSGDYQKEFDHIFSKGDIYADPTVYVNITSKEVIGDAPAGCENWFVMINVPHNSGQDWELLKVRAKEHILTKLSGVLKTDIAKLIEEEAVLDPIRIESKTSSSQGALYGNSSNNRFAAFLRHPNKSRRVKNLYFCGGSVHPGGGIPLCLSSAKIVASYFPDLH
ncbi:1-hydroxycarotenoid 3,4-desaturase CrtD [uncultured Imperialibacter sp.]|uniref:1-hydroxycarotenoid 3,4-desaturase CrtD n=1 Tax=uncultured Imperialibacter sp. TaxID=1672639 RepID=UPI0030DBACA2|tara:strand:- start:5586 stop:7058 length:1473 start_codon:yes stop_codon:yes gene_type:complete